MPTLVTGTEQHMNSDSFTASHSADAHSALPHAGSFRHGSSRMLENYLADIEQLMRERLWTEALSLALALPHIGGALSNGELQSSREHYVAWCETWLRSPAPDGEMQTPSADGLYAMTMELASCSPTAALTQLRLRRLARPAPPRRYTVLAEIPDAREEPAHLACFALVQATHRWYDDTAALDATVQMNLARLAVLR